MSNFKKRIAGIRARDASFDTLWESAPAAVDVEGMAADRRFLLKEHDKLLRIIQDANDGAIEPPLGDDPFDGMVWLSYQLLNALGE